VLRLRTMLGQTGEVPRSQVLQPRSASHLEARRASTTPTPAHELPDTRGPHGAARASERRAGHEAGSPLQLTARV
jgi:hypothetical protein